ncbi:MAG: tyrosine-protein phosphatase [Clostridia bacterium]|nr:tyrosine-protein phosphatase [Clostridia bacterium]
MQIERLKLKKLRNTRDLGGFPTTDGKTIKYGKLIRSGRLYKLPDETVSELKKLGVTTVIDLRNDMERREMPNTEIDGIETINIPLVYTMAIGITHEKTYAKHAYAESKRIKKEFGNADNYMESVYETAIFDEKMQGNLRKIFEVLLEKDGCILWHCNGGKDRAGLVAMLVEGALGVDRELIIEDYVASRKFHYYKQRLQRFGIVVIPGPRHFKGLLRAFIEPKPQYILGVIEKIEQQYGSIQEYCKQALGLTDEQICILKEKYTE